MKVIILAAGIGTRMKEIGKEIPKCLLTINGKSILELQLEVLNDVGIKKEDIHLVIGTEGNCWTKENISKIKTITENIIVNQKNVELNQAYSFLCGITALDEDDILVLDGDIIATSNVITTMISNKDNSTLLVQAPKGVNAVGNKVMLDENKNIIKVTRDFVDKEFTIYAGMFFIIRKDFAIFKDESSNEKYHKGDLGFVFDTLCKKSNFRIFTNDTAWVNINTKEGIKEATRIINH